MNQKIEITKYVMTHQGVEITGKTIKQYIRTLWRNIRIKETGGLQLTEQGFNSLLDSDIKAHRVAFQETIDYTNQVIIWLDHFIDCPWYITKKEIYVFNEKTAVQLVLFSGNITRFSAAKAQKPRPSA
jgi:hypothetical protein